MPAKDEREVAVDSPKSPATAAPKAPKKKSAARKSHALARIWTHRRPIVKYAICAALAICVYVALGTYFEPTSGAALVVVALGKWGTFTYKGLSAFAAFCVLHARMA